MTKPKPDDIGPIEIYPNHVYRVSVIAPALFGLGPDQTRQKILSDELPPPHRPTPTSKILLWTGKQILDHRAKMQQLAIEALQADREHTPAQPPQLAAVNDRRRTGKKATKVKKVRLHPPSGKL